MASQTQAAPPQPQLPVLPLLARSESESRLELAFYEDVLRVSEDDPGLRLRELDVKPGCTAGDNFSSIVMRNTALGVRGDGSPLRRSVMVKQVPQWDRFRCQAAFLKETDAYSTLVPVMRALGERAGLRLPLARCLHASRHLRPDLIILEDLADLGYSMRPRQQGLDHAHAVLVMQALGRFHGMSLSLRRLEPQLFRQLRASCKELIFFPAAEEVFSRSLTASTTMAVLSLRRSGRHDLAERLAARVARRGVFQEMCDVVLPPAEGTAVEPVFTHGDCWANNLLFKYHEDGSPREARLIDLAGIRCASPALDIQHFMSTSLPKGVRDQHRDQLLQHYIDAVKETVGDVTGAKLKPGLGQDLGGLSLESTPAVQVPEGMLSLEELRSELRQRAAFGLWIGLWMLPAVFLSPDVMSALGEPVDYFSEDTQAVLCQAMPEEFHQRLLDLVEEHASAGTL